MTPITLRAALAQDYKTSIEAVQADLAERVPFEQSHLRQILESVGWGRGQKEPLFNTFANILWGPSAVDKTPSTPLLTPWDDDDDVGNAEEEEEEDLAPSQRVPGRTAMEGLDTGVLADENLFFDILRCGGEKDELKLVLRCDRGVLSEEEAEGFLEMVREEVER
ncbi:MAG: hypothetical protein L6R35_007544, partial [Caloplaca aegaea]